MASKEIPPALKASTCERLRAAARGEGTATIADEARRRNVSKQAIRTWVRIDKREHPEAWEHPDPPEGVDPPAVEPPAAGGQAAALAAVGVAPSVDAPSPGPAVQAQEPERVADPDGTTDMDDEAIVRMALNTVMGATVRLPLLVASMKLKTWIDSTPKLNELCVVTDAEFAGIKPAVPFLAPKLRAWIGSNENIALGAAGAMLVQAIMVRLGAVREAVTEAMRKVPAKPAEAQS